MQVFRLVLLICVLAQFAVQPIWAQNKVDWKKVKVLVYTRNGKGYVHDNIPRQVACIQRLGQQHGFAVDVSDAPAVFTEDNLKQYTLLLFPSTNNDVFDTDAQRLAFRRYIEAEGASSGSTRCWARSGTGSGSSTCWAARFLARQIQPFSVKVIDAAHPSVQGLPKVVGAEG
jgi:hypothetical protein